MRFCAFAAPLLLLIYGLLRVADGLDGDRHNGSAWDLGHVAFFCAIVLFAVLAVALRRLDRPAGVSLDLLPLGAVLVLAVLLPLARPRDARLAAGRGA